MKRLSIGLLAVLTIAGFGETALAQVTPPANFGSPPSGSVPILYNDQHIYTKPDILKQSRVLAALVQGDTILIPLRSMFEQMGAAVSYDPSTQTVEATKAGADVKVTVGKPEVIINGESRPLDVPPEMYRGVLLVPVRVISEGMGAYVEWEPDKRLVVVRYIPATPPPAPEPTTAPTIAPPAPTPTPTPEPPYGFIAGAIIASKDYNEFTAGGHCKSYLFNGGFAFRHSPIAVKVDYREDTYLTSDNLTDILGNEYTHFGTIDGGTAFTPVFLARQSTLDARVEYQIAAPRIYVGVSYIYTSNNYGYPHLSGFGAGIEKLPDLRTGINAFGSVFYYPDASGNYTVADPTSSNFGKNYRQQYQIVKYDVGLALIWARSPVYLFGGFSGDQYMAKQNAPIGQTHDGPYLGLGVKI